MTGPMVILGLKAAVALATILLCAALVALVLGRVRLHGQINIVFFVAVVATLILFEGIIRFTHPGVFEYIQENPDLLKALRIHLGFSIPSALLLPLMLWTGYTRRKKTHLALAILFSIAWTGTAVTGIFFLPHQ